MKHIAQIFLIGSIFIILSVVAINYSFEHGGVALTGLEIIEPQMFKDTSRQWVVPHDNRVMIEAQKLGQGVFSAKLTLKANNYLVWNQAYYLTRDGWNPIDFITAEKKDWLTGTIRANIKDFEARLPTGEMAADALGVPSYDDNSLIVISYWCEKNLNGQCACMDNPECAYWVLSSVKI